MEADAQKPLLDYMTHAPVRTRGVLALGNFDGVHLGHCEVMASARRQAQQLGCEVHALTFYPHPYAMFQKEGNPFLLTSLEDKIRLLHEAGADHVITLAFTPTFAAKTPDEFIRDILVEGCAVRHVVVGFDFVFGRGRGGNREALRRCLAPLEIGVTEVPPFRDDQGEVISSSRIRAALRLGDVALAHKLLGRAFTVCGTIQKGDQLGRELGFPTANIDFGELIRPAYGVYAVSARRVGTSHWYNGVANVGIRPTIANHREWLEFHLFDFDRDIYDEVWDVAFHHYLRSEKAFENLNALKTQIRADVSEAKDLLNVKN